MGNPDKKNIQHQNHIKSESFVPGKNNKINIANHLSFFRLIMFPVILYFALSGRENFEPHKVSFLIFIAFLVFTVVLSLIKFRRFPSFHLYTTKIGGFIEGIFFVCLFTIGFITPFYYFMIIWGILGAIEHISIQLIIPEMRSNVKGLYWVLRDKKQRDTK